MKPLCPTLRNGALFASSSLTFATLFVPLFLLCQILQKAEQVRRSKQHSDPCNSSSDVATSFSATTFVVPEDQWDLTEAELHPLSWYITDPYVVSTIHMLFDGEVTDWELFTEKFSEEIKCFFHDPNTPAAASMGCKPEPFDPSKFRPSSAKKEPGSIQQQFDADDVISLDDP